MTSHLHASFPWQCMVYSIMCGFYFFIFGSFGRSTQRSKHVAVFLQTGRSEKILKNGGQKYLIIISNFIGCFLTVVPFVICIYATLKIFSIFLPFASSSTNLSKYLTFCVSRFSISSSRYPQITPVIS